MIRSCTLLYQEEDGGFSVYDAVFEGSLKGYWEIFAAYEFSLGPANILFHFWNQYKIGNRLPTYSCEAYVKSVDYIADVNARRSRFVGKKLMLV